jgi:AraC family transcriptional regulator
MDAPDILANMTRGWNRAPAGVARGTERSGISTALWTHACDDVQEVWANPDPGMHLIAVTYGNFHCEKFIDGRIAFSKVLSSGLFNIVQAGARPRAVLTGEWRVLHLYLPAVWLCDFVNSEELSPHATGLELVNPKGVYDTTVDRLAREVLVEMRDGQPLSRLRIDTLGQDLAICLLRSYSNLVGTPRLARQPPDRVTADWRIRRAMQYLDAHLAQDVGLAELAADIGLSTGHLAAAFRRQTGLPPHRWLMRRRLDRARDLLANSSRSVTEIAHACGFASSQHMATLFRRQTGQTPSEHRRQRQS